MIRPPHITGKSVPEQIAQIIRYLQEIAEAIRQIQLKESEE